VFSGGIRVKVVSSGDFTVGERALVVVSSILSSSCCRWRGATPWGWHPSTIIRLQGFSSCSPAAVPCRWSSRRMTTSLVVGRSKSGCGLPPALSFKDVHHPCWGGGCAELGPHLRVGSDRLLPSVFGGEGHSLFMRGRRTSGTRGWLTAGVASHLVPDALAWIASVLPPTLPSAARSGCGCPFTA
jgi:hypothetical protein